MIKFFLMTRGRTGSTAVIDELNKSKQLKVTQELFLKYDFRNNPGAVALYDLIDPYDVWVENGIINKYYSVTRETKNYSRYLAKASDFANIDNAKSFGFKLLSHHFCERDGLLKVLKDQDYKVLYLTRNIARQVLSGMIAKQRGIYNTTEEVDHDARFMIDVQEFGELIKIEEMYVSDDIRLVRANYDVLEISYEELIGRRERFYAKIFEFLSLDSEEPPRSDYKVMIKDISSAVTNYDDVFNAADSMGYVLK